MGASRGYYGLRVSARLFLRSIPREWIADRTDRRRGYGVPLLEKFLDLQAEILGLGEQHIVSIQEMINTVFFCGRNCDIHESSPFGFGRFFWMNHSISCRLGGMKDRKTRSYPTIRRFAGPASRSR